MRLELAETGRGPVLTKHINAMNTFSITVRPETDGAEEYTVTIDSGCCTREDVLTELNDQLESDELPLCEEFEVTDWDDIPVWAQDFDVLSDLMPEFEGSYYDIEVFEAAHDANISFSEVGESYSGKFDSDEEFAQDIAENIGAIDRNASWPNNHIDWERAASDLMQDYTESNGHYFRA